MVKYSSFDIIDSSYRIRQFLLFLVNPWNVGFIYVVIGATSEILDAGAD